MKGKIKKLAFIFLVIVVFFSSCNSSSTINTNATTTINNLSQYTDIALFINSEITDFSLSNSLKSLSIRDISFVTSPSIGSPSLYYKSLSNFATPEVDENNIFYLIIVLIQLF